MPVKTLIMGAAGRDFHNFNVLYRDDDDYRVVAFTATQIPDIAARRYPAALAGKLYPDGIPIFPEEDLAALIAREKVDQVVFSYSDVSHLHVMHRASLVNARGADFVLVGAARTMLGARKPVVAVCAVRTGAGKSQTTRYVAAALGAAGKRVAIVRHPMPYGDLAKQAAQRFAALPDMDEAECTIEEREEYEPLIAQGHAVFTGVDYARVLAQAEAEADVIIWDGGNNDTPFFKPDVHIVVADPLRAGHEVAYHPGETNLRMADVVVINKVDAATPAQVAEVKGNVAAANPGAVIVEAASPVSVENAAEIKGARVLCVEDGPTVTHGNMASGAACAAARAYGAAVTVDPRPYAVGTLKTVFENYPHLGPVLPAMGYGEQMVRDLEATVKATPADLVLSGTPIDLLRLIACDKPVLRVTYELKVLSTPDLATIIRERLGL